MKKKFNPQRGQNPALVQMKREREVISASASANMLLTLLALHSPMFGFGTVRLERFLREWEKVLKSYNNGERTLEEMRQKLKDETGIEVK